METTVIPDAWQGVPLAQLGLATVADALLGPRDRRCGALAVVITDPQGHVRAPFVVTDVPLEQGLRELQRFVTQLADVACHVAPRGGLALVLGRPGPLARSTRDEAWRSALLLACRQAHLRADGFALATPDGFLALDDDVAAA